MESGGLVGGRRAGLHDTVFGGARTGGRQSQRDGDMACSCKVLFAGGWRNGLESRVFVIWPKSVLN